MAPQIGTFLPLQPPQKEPRSGVGIVLATPPQRAQIDDD